MDAYTLTHEIDYTKHGGERYFIRAIDNHCVNHYPVTPAGLIRAQRLLNALLNKKESNGIRKALRNDNH